MIKYYYASITDKNLYIDDINLLEYLNKYFHDIYIYYQHSIKRSNSTSIDIYKEFRTQINNKILERGLSPYLLLKNENGELRELNTNSPLTVSNFRKPKLKELSKEELGVLYTDDYKKRTNKYIYLPSALDNNPIFDLDYIEEKKFKIVRKTN